MFCQELLPRMKLLMAKQKVSSVLMLLAQRWCLIICSRDHRY